MARPAATAWAVQEIKARLTSNQSESLVMDAVVPRVKSDLASTSSDSPPLVPLRGCDSVHRMFTLRYRDRVQSTRVYSPSEDVRVFKNFYKRLAKHLGKIFIFF